MVINTAHSRPLFVRFTLCLNFGEGRSVELGADGDGEYGGVPVVVARMDPNESLEFIRKSLDGNGTLNDTLPLIAICRFGWTTACR